MPASALQILDAPPKCNKPRREDFQPASGEDGQVAAAAPQSHKPRREDLKPGECLCMYCTAKCCRYFALAMDKPTTWRDFDHMRWFLLHERASVFVEDGAWYLLVHTPCKHLQADNLCGIYETRPNICRAYTTDKCEYDEDWVYDHYWETAEQVEEYAEAVLGPRRGAGFRSKRPNRT